VINVYFSVMFYVVVSTRCGVGAAIRQHCIGHWLRLLEGRRRTASMDGLWFISDVIL